MHIKILGAGGFIGSYLNEKLKILGHCVYPIFKDQNLNFPVESQWVNHESFSDSKPRVVINLSGAWRNASKQEIIESNYEYPRVVLEQELSLGGMLIWIQASSYYQLYKNIYGIDKDQYSEQKRLFSNFLIKKSEIHHNLKVIDIIIPYITGPKEPRERIFSLIALAKINKKILNLSSGTSILPILDVRDFSDFIALKIQEYEFEFDDKPEAIYPLVSDILTLRSHIEIYLEEATHLCNFGVLPDRTNEFTNLSEIEEYYKLNQNLRSLTISFNDQVEFLRCKKKNIK
jgi:nucleoside-diphosphate-sugar epimerase